MIDYIIWHNFLFFQVREQITMVLLALLGILVTHRNIDQRLTLMKKQLIITATVNWSRE